MNMSKIWTILKGGEGGGNGISQMDICPWKEGSIQPTDAKKTFQLSLVFDKNNSRHKKDVENVDNRGGGGGEQGISQMNMS